MKSFGYTGSILMVDLSSGKCSRLPSAPYTEKYIGGRGVAAALYWELACDQLQAFAPENPLIFATGPATGFSGFAGNRWQLCGKSPSGRQSFSYASLGGRWGAFLKFAGHDALVVVGKAPRPLYLLIVNDRVELRDAGHLWGRSTFAACDLLKAEWGDKAAVLAIGPAGENMIGYANMITDDGASGSAGLGGVMGSKLLKAVVVGGESRPAAADPAGLREAVSAMRRLRPPGKGAAISTPWMVPGVTRPMTCYGCGVGCSRHYYIHEGRKYKSLCQAAMVYAQPGERTLGENQRLATRLCDGYGIDTAVLMGLAGWLEACYREGLLDERRSGLPLAKFGSAEYIEELTRKIAHREGFGDLLARGTAAAAESLGGKAVELLTRFISTPGSETKDYDPRLIPVTALLYATAPRRPIQELHEPGNLLMMWLRWSRGEGFFSGADLRRAAELFWGSAAAADFTTYRGKALAAKKIQDRTCAKESLLLCDFKWPMTWANYEGGHVGDPSLESRIYSAITGRKTDEAGLNEMGERIFNLQRAILLRQGWRGRADDRLLDYYYTEPLREGEIFFNPRAEVPGPDGAPVSRLGNVLDREEMERLKDEYYSLRGWDRQSGFPTRSKLQSLGLEGVAEALQKQGLLAEK